MSFVLSRFSCVCVVFVCYLTGGSGSSTVLDFTQRKEFVGSSWRQPVTKADVQWPGLNRSTDAFQLSFLSPDEAQSILDQVKEFNDFSFEADSTDGAPAYEAYLVQTAFGHDVLPKLDRETQRQREQLLAITAPIISDRILPFVNDQYEACKGTCRVCTSLLRRYMEGERRVVEDHHDLDALVTVVVSLTSSGPKGDYEGGLYVSVAGRRLQVPLDVGHGIVHQTDLFHGVDVSSGDRWSWITWIEREECKKEDSVSWYLDAAEAGDPVAQYIMYVHYLTNSNRDSEAGDASKFKTRLQPSTVRSFLAKSAKQGFPASLSALGQLYVEGGLGMKANLTKGRALLKKAASASERSALLYLGVHYAQNGEAQKALDELSKPALQGDRRGQYYLGVLALQNGKLKQAAKYLEASGRSEAYAVRADIEQKLGSPKDSPAVLSWVAKAARMGHQESCERYRTSAKPDATVVIDCLAVQGADGVDILLDNVFPTLTAEKDKAHAVRVVRSLSATMPNVKRRLDALIKKHRIEL